MQDTALQEWEVLALTVAAGIFWTVVRTPNACEALRIDYDSASSDHFRRVDGAIRCSLWSRAVRGPSPPLPRAAARV